MNNEQFRKLVQNTPARQGNASPSDKNTFGAKKSSLLGGMTPRPGKTPGSSSSNDFARQIRERHASLQPTKKFKTYAPKGSKFAAGYVDRAKARQEAQDAEDDKEQRVKALEEQVKLGQLPYETFEALRDQITGGDFESAHLVKGLDRKLLERVRRGEDVMGTGASKNEAKEEDPVDVDDELDKLGEQEIETVKREKVEKKGSTAPPPVAGVKRSRDEILAELKAQRKAAAEAKAAAAPTLDSRWKRVGEQAKPRIEIDHKGREVLITVGEDGTVKKKVRKVASDNAVQAKPVADMPDASKEILGADFIVPEQPMAAPPPDEDEDDDIFENVGTEYNPLGDVEDDDSDDSDDSDEARKPAKDKESAASSTAPAEKSDTSSKAPSEPPTGLPKRNYFNEKSTTEDQPVDKFKDIENIIKKAARLGAAGPNEEGDDDQTEGKDARLAKRAKMLAQEDRDLDDMDMGFGSSRYEDEEEGGGEKKVKLSEWKGGAAGGDDGWEEDKKSRGDKPKRKPKKRKGDVNNAADIFRVIEGRKAGTK